MGLKGRGGRRPARANTSSQATAERHERALAVVRRLGDAYPARIELEFDNPLQLAVATILSAQCTDRRVNEVTGKLFKKYRTAEDYANADPDTFEEEIRPTGFFRNKTRSIISFAQALVDGHDGAVPGRMEELVSLAGIGRKTANVILGSGFGVNAGIAVDTHVKRVVGRLELTGETDPEKIERDLMELVPQKEWTNFSLRVIQHGRYTCTARRPACRGCPLEDICPSAHTFD